MSTERDSNAYAAGIRTGDLLVKANRKILNVKKDFIDAYSESDKLLIHNLNDKVRISLEKLKK